MPNEDALHSRLAELRERLQQDRFDLEALDREATALRSLLEIQDEELALPSDGLGCPHQPAQPGKADLP